MNLVKRTERCLLPAALLSGLGCRQGYIEHPAALAPSAGGGSPNCLLSTLSRVKEGRRSQRCGGSFRQDMVLMLITARSAGKAQQRLIQQASKFTIEAAGL